MAIITFSDLQSKINCQKVILAEIEPYICPVDWSKTSGKTNVYQITLSAVDASDNKISKVRENDNTYYLEVGSTTACDSLVSSYYYDSTNHILYVHTSTAANPTTLIIAIYFKMYFSNETKHALAPLLSTELIYYYPMIVSVPSLSRSLGTIGQGGLPSYSIGNLVLENCKRSTGEGFWDDIIYTYIWFGAEVKILCGGESLPYSEYKQVGTYIIKSIEKNFEEIHFVLSDQKEFLDREIPDDLFDIDIYTNMEDGRDGEVIPIAYGLVKDFKPTCIDTTTQQYKVCNHDFIMLAAYDYTNAGIRIPVGFKANNADGEFTLNAAPIGQVTVDFIGKVSATNKISTNASFETYASSDFTDWTKTVSGSSTITQSSGSTQIVDASYGAYFHETAGSAECSLKRTLTLDADTWYRVAFYGKADNSVAGSKISLRIYDNTLTKYLVSDRTWAAAETWCLNIDYDILVSDMQGASMVFKTTSSTSYEIRIGIPASVTAACDCYADMAIVCETYEMPSSCIKDLCTTFLDLPATIYDEGNLSEFEADRPYPLGFVVSGKTKGEDIFTRIDVALCAYHFVDRGGQIKFHKWALPDSEVSDTDIQTYTKYNFLSMKEGIDIDDIIWSVNIGYANWINDTRWNWSPSTDTVTKYKYRTSKELKLETILAYKEDAADIASEYLTILDNKRVNIVLRASLKPLYSDLGDTINLAMNRWNQNVAANIIITKIDENWDNSEIVLTGFMTTSEAVIEAVTGDTPLDIKYGSSVEASGWDAADVAALEGTTSSYTYTGSFAVDASGAGEYILFCHSSSYTSLHDDGFIFNSITCPFETPDTVDNYKVYRSTAAQLGNSSLVTSLSASIINRIFWGISTEASGWDSTDVNAFANYTASNTKGRDFTVTAGANDYIMYALPSRLGTVIFYYGGLEGGFEAAATVSVTNINGYVEDYRVYRSTNKNLGATTVTAV
jgi:hypothetical protein